MEGPSYKAVESCNFTSINDTTFIWSVPRSPVTFLQRSLLSSIVHGYVMYN